MLSSFFDLFTAILHYIITRAKRKYKVTMVPSGFLQAAAEITLFKQVNSGVRQDYYRSNVQAAFYRLIQPACT